MSQGHEELAGVLAIIAGECLPNVIADHLANGLGPSLLAEKILAQRRGGDLGNVLVLRDGEDFVLGQAAHGDAVIQRDHVGGSLGANGMIIRIMRSGLAF
jgi:hypothetical protein